MDKKFKYAVTLCPAAVNAMEDINNEISTDSVDKFTEQFFENKYSKAEVDLRNEIYDKVAENFKDDDVESWLSIKKVLCKEELDMLIKYKFDFLTYISKIREKDPGSFFYFTTIIPQENFEEKLYVNSFYLYSIYYFLSQKKDEKGNTRLSFKNVISVNFDKNKENLFQSKSFENVNLLQQMKDITDTLRNNNLLKFVEKDSSTETEKFTIDDKFFIKKNNNYISIENGNQNNPIGITIKKNKEDHLIEIGNEEKGYFIINPTWTFKKEAKDFLLKGYKNVGKIIKYYHKKNSINFLFTIADKNDGREIASLEDSMLEKNDESININNSKAYLSNCDLFIGNNKIGIIGGAKFGPYFNINSGFTYYDCAKTSFVIIANEENGKKKTIISSSGNEIKISLVNESSLLVFNLFLNDKHKTIYNFSYFKDNFQLFPYKGSTVDYDYNFSTNGNTYHILNKRFFKYEINDANNISGIFNDNDEYTLKCSLKRNIFELITLSEFNKYGFRQIIDKRKKAQVIYKNGNIFDFNINNKYGDCKLYRYLDEKRTNTFIDNGGKLTLYNKNLECYIEIDHLCQIKFYRFAEKREYIKLEDINVDNYDEFINNILENYMKAYKYFEMYRNFYGENKEHEENYYCINDLYKYFNEKKNKNENEINIKNPQNEVKTIELNGYIDKKNILDYVVSKRNKEIIEKLIKDSDGEIRIKIVNDLTDINGNSVKKYQEEEISIIDIINNRYDKENKYINDTIMFHFALLISEEKFFYGDIMKYDLKGFYHYSITNIKRLYLKIGKTANEWLLLYNIAHFKK